jgi:hypothetical protein
MKHMSVYRLMVAGIPAFAWLVSAGSVFSGQGVSGGSGKTAPAASAPQQATQNWAIVIGINRGGSTPSRYCVKDALALAKTLRERCGYASTSLFVMTDGPGSRNRPSRNNILETARQWAERAGECDTLIFYFSGQGVGIEDKGYLVPADADLSGGPPQPDRLIALADLRKVLQSSKTSRRVMVLDVCRVGQEKDGTPRIMSAALEQALKTDCQGMATLVGCQSDETSLDASWYKHGLFSYWLIQGLGGAADREEAGNKDQCVDFDELYLYVDKHVQSEATQRLNRVQRPLFLATLGDGFELACLTGEAIGTATATAPGGDLSRRVLDKELVLDLGEGVKLELVLIPPGEFLMGSPDTDPFHNEDECPQHRVRITLPFYMGKYEVTQAQWQAVLGSNPSRFTGDPRLPVERVTWDDCQVFCKRLSGKVGMTIRLPTEAQWE